MIKQIVLFGLTILTLYITNGQIGIGTTSPDQSSILDISSTEAGLLIPRMTTTERDAILSPAKGLLIYNIDHTSLEINNGIPTIPNWNSLVNTSTVTVDCIVNGFTGIFSEGVTLTGVHKFSVTLTNNGFSDANLSFNSSDVTLSGVSGISVGSPSITSATLTSGQNIQVDYVLTGTPTSIGELRAEWQKLNLYCTETTDVLTPFANFSLPGLGVVSSVTIPVDIQGIIDNGSNQLIIQIPYDSGIGGYNAHTGSYIPNRSGTGEGGDVNGFRISYPLGDLNTSGTIDLTVEVDGDGSFDVRKQAVGNVDTIAVIDFPFNGTSQGNIVLLAVGGIPDRRFSDPEHQFIYMPIVALDGNTWLNNNLGAYYNDINHPQYNPTQQATSYSDYLAYGSLFQWGRYSDGHELIDYTSATVGTSVYGVTPTLSNNPTPGHSLYIPNNTNPRDWLSPQDNSLWQGESGLNNPCPKGYRIPTNAEWTILNTAESISNGGTAFSSTLVFTRPGYVNFGNGAVYGVGTGNYYWSSSILGVNAYRIFFANISFFADPRSEGYPCRCIKD